MKYKLVDRNIHLCAGRYRVLITRRPNNIYGGRFEKLSQAIKVRDALESKTPKKSPARAQMFGPLRTNAVTRFLRRQSGLCQSCGTEPPKQGCVTCQGCMDAMHFKRKYGVE